MIKERKKERKKERIKDKSKLGQIDKQIDWESERKKL